MFERFTDNARRAIFFARNEASQRGASRIGADDLLLGLLREDDILLPQIFGPDIDSLREEIKGQILQPISIPNEVNLPLSVEAKRVLATAIEESKKLGHCHVSTLHLLLGLLRDPNSTTARILRKRGLNLEAEKEWLRMFAPVGYDFTHTEVRDFTLLSKMAGTMRRIFHR